MTKIEAHLDAAEMLIQVGRYAKAEIELRQTLQLSPDHPGALLVLTHLRVMEKRYADGLETARALLKQDPQNYDARFWMAVCLGGMNFPAEAVNAWRDLLRTHAQDADVHANLAQDIYWAPKLGIPADEVRVHLREALRLDPLNRMALHLEFWMAFNEDDQAKAQAVIARLQTAYPDEAFAARLLSQFIRTYQRADQAKVGALLRLFPTDPELLRLAQEVAAIRDWMDIARDHLLELLPLKPVDYVPAFLEDAEKNAANFTLRRLAKTLRHQEAADQVPFARLLVEIAHADAGRPVRIRPLLRHVYQAMKVEEREHVLAVVFDTYAVEFFGDVLLDQEVQPSAETWARIWPRVLERDQLLKGVIERYGAFRVKPPLTIADAFDARTGRVREDMYPVVRTLARGDVEAASYLWSRLVAEANRLTPNEREELFGMLPKPERLVKQPGFASELSQTLAHQRTIAAYAGFWDELAYMTEAWLYEWSQQADYPALLDTIFETLFAHYEEEFASRLAGFLAKAPFDPAAFGPRQTDLRRCAERTKDPTLAARLRDVLERFPTSEVAAQSTKALSDDLRQTLHKNNLEVVQILIKAAEAQFRQRIAELTADPKLTVEERTQGIQKAATDYQQEIAALTASLERKPA